jgi:hypothetical protein
MPNQKNDQMNWCKILTMPDRHVLVERIFDTEHEKPSVRISTPMKFCHAVATAGYSDEKKADQTYESITNETISNWIEACFKPMLDIDKKGMTEHDDQN